MSRTDEQHAAQWVSRATDAVQLTDRIDDMELRVLSTQARRVLREAYLAGMRQARLIERRSTTAFQIPQ